MNQNQIMKQMIEFNQATFNSAFSANVLLQDQFERMANTVLDQTAMLPVETRKAIDNWAEAYKTGRQDLKKYIDDSYKKCADFFAG